MYRVKSAHEQLIYNSIALKWDLTSQLDVALWRQQLLAFRPNLGVSLLPPRFNEIIHELGGGRSWRRWWGGELKRGRRTTMRKGVGVSHHPSRVRPHWSPSVAERWSFNHSRPMIVAISARCRPLGPIYPLSSLPGPAARRRRRRRASSVHFLGVWTRLRPSSQWHFGQLVASLLGSWLSPFQKSSTHIVSYRLVDREDNFHSCDFIRQRTFGFIIPEDESL